MNLYERLKLVYNRVVKSELKKKKKGDEEEDNIC
jgi:hypothetical protein